MDHFLRQKMFFVLDSDFHSRILNQIFIPEFLSRTLTREILNQTLIQGWKIPSNQVLIHKKGFTFVYLKSILVELLIAAT